MGKESEKNKYMYIYILIYLIASYINFHIK